MNNKKGISLIVLVITILVMIILAGVVIVSLQNDNPIDKAKFAKMVDSVQSVRGAISQYAVTKQADSTDQTGKTVLDGILGAVVGGSNETYKTWKALDNDKAKGLLGVDPTNIKDGKFYVNPDTGASIFVLNKNSDGTANKFDSQVANVDGILPSTTDLTK